MPACWAGGKVNVFCQISFGAFSPTDKGSRALIIETLTVMFGVTQQSCEYFHNGKVFEVGEKGELVD